MKRTPAASRGGGILSHPSGWDFFYLLLGFHPKPHWGQDTPLRGLVCPKPRQGAALDLQGPQALDPLAAASPQNQYCVKEG